MISNRFIKKVPKISQLEDKYSAIVYDSKMPFFCSQEGVKGPAGPYGCLEAFLPTIGVFSVFPDPTRMGVFSGVER